MSLCLAGISVWRGIDAYKLYRTEPSDLHRLILVFCGFTAVFWVSAGIWVTWKEKK